MKKDLRIVIVVAVVATLVLLVTRTLQDKGEYHNDSSWAKAQERFLSK